MFGAQKWTVKVYSEDKIVYCTELLDHHDAGHDKKYLPFISQSSSSWKDVTRGFIVIHIVPGSHITIGDHKLTAINNSDGGSAHHQMIPSYWKRAQTLKLKILVFLYMDMEDLENE